MRFKMFTIGILLSVGLFCCAPATSQDSERQFTSDSVLEQASVIPSSGTIAALELKPTDQLVSTVIPATPPSTDTLGLPTPIAQEILNGKLYIIDSEGVSYLPLDDTRQEYILTKGSDWIDWRASFSKTGHFLAYWKRTSTTSELWLTQLRTWSPELILSFKTEHDVVSLEWLAGDRYLLVRLGVFEDREVGQKILVVRSYIIDSHERSIKTPENWAGGCGILAFSPQTNYLATWCSEKSEGGDVQSDYIVVEANGDIWFTEQQPDEILKEIKFDGETIWSFSPDGQYVSYTLFEDGEHLFYTPTERNSPTILMKNSSSAYSFLGWSFDSQFLSYFGKCPNGHFCQAIIDVTIQRMVWNSQMNDLDNAHPLTWSPDSQHIAVSVLDEIFVIDIKSQQVILQFQNVPLIEMIWVH